MNYFLFFISSDYIYNKSIVINIFFNILETYNKLSFIDKIHKYVIINCLYTVYIKMRFNNNSYTICNDQFGFDFKFNTNINIL